MGTKVHLQMDSAEKIMVKRNLGKKGSAPLFWANEVYKAYRGYVPRDNGPLEDKVTIRPTGITHEAIYGRRWYFTHPGDGLRGKEWDKRMWADNKDRLLQSLADYAGGKVK